MRMNSDQLEHYRGAKEDLQRAATNFIEVCTTMTPEMEIIREVTKLKGDFGRNKESKWLSDFNKIEEVKKKKKRYVATTTTPNSMDVGASGYTPMAMPTTSIQSTSSLPSSTSLSARDELDLAIRRLHRLKVSGEMSPDELEQRLEQLQF